MKDLDWHIIYELHQNPNITHVAGRLFKTQSAITKRLQNIEEEVSVKIVARTPKGLVFTKEGNFLYEQAEKYLRLETETAEGIQALKAEEKNNLLIGSAYTFAKYNLPRVLEPFMEAHPDISCRIINRQSDILRRMLLEGEADAAFIRGDFCDGVNKIYVGSMAAYCVSKAPVRISDLPSMEEIGYQTNDKTKEILETWWEEQFGSPRAESSIEVGYIDFAYANLRREGRYMLCFLPDCFPNELGLTLTPLFKKDGSRLKRNTWFIYKKEKRKSHALEELIQYIEKEVAIHEIYS